MICSFIVVLFDQRLALKRLIDISMGVITPLSEQLTKPLPNAMVLVNLKELSTGAYKLLPEGGTLSKLSEYLVTKGSSNFSLFFFLLFSYLNNL